jgi:hypothetical protein
LGIEGDLGDDGHHSEFLMVTIDEGRGGSFAGTECGL